MNLACLEIVGGMRVPHKVVRLQFSFSNNLFEKLKTNFGGEKSSIFKAFNPLRVDALSSRCSSVSVCLSILARTHNFGRKKVELICRSPTFNMLARYNRTLLSSSIFIALLSSSLRKVIWQNCSALLKCVKGALLEMARKEKRSQIKSKSDFANQAEFSRLSLCNQTLHYATFMRKKLKLDFSRSRYNRCSSAGAVHSASLRNA